ncbi:ATP-binding cassette domain-containing protein, partial [Spirulina sp. 06S082]|uniref:ATP-binding cassette domain-containing protein n=1 Tax=Spirulina sp. 06S082 TaxID=3110248 RepID=UPI002B217162
MTIDQHTLEAAPVARKPIDTDIDVRTGRSADHRGAEVTFALDRLRVHYGDVLAVKDISMEIFHKDITALIGPSGCGKSTLLRCFNRMNDLIPSARVEGQLLYHGE